MSGVISLLADYLHDDFFLRSCRVGAGEFEGGGCYFNVLIHYSIKIGLTYNVFSHFPNKTGLT